MKDNIRALLIDFCENTSKTDEELAVAHGTTRQYINQLVKKYFFGMTPNEVRTFHKWCRADSPKFDKETASWAVVKARRDALRLALLAAGPIDPVDPIERIR